MQNNSDHFVGCWWRGVGGGVQVAAPTVDDMQRELLAICKGHDNYETWARVSGQPINERINEVGRIGKRRAVHDLRLSIHAINPDAALYFGWCPGEDGPSAKREFFDSLLYVAKAQGCAA